MAINIEGVVDWLRGWFYTKEETNTYLNAKANKNLTNANMNVVTDSSGDITTEAKPTIPTSTSELINDGSDGSDNYVETGELSDVAISGDYDDLDNKPVIDTALNANSTNAVQNKAITTGVTQAIAKATDVDNKLTSHTNTDSTGHTTTGIKDTNTYNNIGNTSQNQQSINSAIDAKIGALLDIDLITIVESLPTASVDTMNKFYLVAEEEPETTDAYEIFITVEDDGEYAWEKVDSARIDLSNYYTKTQTDNLLSFKANWDDVDELLSDTNVYFVSSLPAFQDSNFHSDGLYLLSDGDGYDAYVWQAGTSGKLGDYGKWVLKAKMLSISEINQILSSIGNKADKSGGVQQVTDNNAHSNIGTVAGATQGAINTAIDNILEYKADVGDVITSITLVPKSTDANGKIIFYTNDEPT